MKKQGATLLELLLYITLLSIVIGGVSLLTPIMQESVQKEKSIMQVEKNGQFLIKRITKSLRDATKIISPTKGELADRLEIETTKGKELFWYENNKIWYEVGDREKVSLMTDSVVLSEIVFRNLSKQNTKGTIRVEATVEFVTESERVTRNYKKIFFGSGTIR